MIIKFKKAVSLIAANCFLLSFVYGQLIATVVSNAQSAQQYRQIFTDFMLPYSYGKITDAHFASSDRVVINIQDLHCHPQVQKNIGNIIEMFDRQYGVKNIYLEGAYGDVDTNWISQALASDPSKKSEVIDKMVETGRLTGAEYFSALSGKQIIKGLEKKEPYLDNLKRFGDILENKEKIDVILQAVNQADIKLKDKYYDRRQLKLEQLSKEYTLGKISAEKYYTLLSKHIDRLGIDIYKYDNTLSFMSLITLQKDLKYTEISRQLQNLVVLLQSQLPSEAFDILKNSTDNFSKVDKLYGYLIKIARQYNLDLSVNFPELDKYFQYIELSQKINPLKLLEENQKLTDEINSRFSRTKAQSEIVFLVTFEKYLKDYLTSKITSDDYVYYRQNIEKYKKLWAKYVDNKVLSLLDGYLAEADKFYQINTARNNYFTDNIFNEIAVSSITPKIQAKDDMSNIIENMSEVKRIDVIITGGFHTGTVSEILKNHNVSYIVITPNVTDGIQTAEDTYYKAAKEQSKISFQTLANLVTSLSPVDQKRVLAAADPELAASLGALAEDARERILDNAQIKELADTVKMAEMLLSDDRGNIKQKIVESIKERLGANSKASEEVNADLVNYINKDKLQKAFEGTQDLEELIEYSLRIRNAKNDNVLNQSLEMLAELTEHMMFFVKELQKLASLERPRVVTDFSSAEKMAEASNKADLADFMFEELIGSKDLLEESPESLADKILNFYNVTIVDNVNAYFDSLSLDQRRTYLGKNTIKTKEELAKKIEAIILTSSNGLEQFISAKGYDTGKEYIHKIISDIITDGVLLTSEEIIKKVRTAEDIFLKTYLVQETVDVETKRNEIAEFISENIGLPLEEFKEKAKEKFGNINEDVWNKQLKKYMQIKAGQLPDLDFPEKIISQSEAEEISQIASRSKSYQDFISSFGTKYGEKTFGISRTRQGNYLKGDKTRGEIVEFGDCDKISSTWAQFNDQNYEINRYGTQDIKFHISASSENAQEIYDLVRPVLDKYNMVFKVAVNKGKLQSLKNTQVGKFITIYLPKGQSLQTLIDLGLELDVLLSSYNNRNKSPEILNEIKLGSSGILTVRDEAMERGVETEKQTRALQFVDFFNKSKENMLKIWDDRSEPNNSDAVKKLAEKVIANKGSYRDFVDVVKNMYGKKAFGISRTRKGSIDRKTKDEFSGEMYNEFGDSDYGPNMLGTWSTLYDQDYMMSPKGGHGHVKGNEDIKLHISASVDNAQETYDLVRPILDKYNIPFKVARTMENLIELNSGNDTQVGKFMTIYLPKGQSYDVLTDLALELDSALSSHIFSSQSPVILNELQLGSSGKLTFRDEEQERGTSNHNDIEKNFLIKFNTSKSELTDIWKELGGENLEQNEQITVQKEAKIILDNAKKYAASKKFSFLKYGNGILRSAKNILVSTEMPELLSQNEAEKQLEMYLKADIEGKENGFQQGSFVDLQNSGKRVILVGDTHAKYQNIISIVEQNRSDLENGSAVIVFLGDMIHSEDNLYEMNSSMVTMQYYMWLKIAYPKNIYMLTGNHDIGTGMRKGNANQGQLYYSEMESTYGKDYVHNYRTAVLKTFALVAEGDEWIASHAGPVKGKTLSDISKEIINKTILEIFKDKNIKDINNMELVRIDFLNKLTWSREADGNYNSGDVNNFAGNKMLVVGHSPKRDRNVNWYWDSSKDIEGEGKADSHIIIFAGTKEAFGYMEFIPEKISELDKTENSLQSKSTVEYLNKIGNSNFIKWLYSAKANKIGENFRYTVFGTALGVIFETFSFWSPNFIEAHDNPTMAMKIVVWVIRALSIGIGVTVAISPLSPILIVPAVILTEWITHFSWNQIQILKGIKSNILQKNNSQIESNSDIFKNIAENIDFNDLLIDWEKEIPFVADATKEILKDRINNLKLSEHNLKAVQLSLERITKSVLLGQKQFMFDAFSRSPKMISYADIIFDDLVSLYKNGDFTVDENNFGVKKIIQEIENNEKRELTKEEKDIIIIFVKHIKHEILSTFGSKLNFVPRLYAFKTYNDAKNKVINGNLSLETWIHICEGHMPGFNQRKSATGDEYYSENEFAYDYSFTIDELKYVKDIYSEPDAVIALNERDSFGNKQVLYIKNINGNIYICDILENGAIKSIYKLSKSKYLQSDGQLDFDSINNVYGRKGMMLQNNKDYNYQNLQNKISEYMKNLSEEFIISNNFVEKNGTIILQRINNQWVSPEKSAEIFFEIKNKGVFFRYDGKNYFYNTNIENIFDFGILELYNLELNDNKKEDYLKIKINGEMFLLSKRGNISRESEKKFMEGDKTLIFYNSLQMVFLNFDKNGKFQHKNRSFGYEVMERTNSILGLLFLRINEYANFIFKISKNGSKWVVEKSKLEALANFKYINDPNSYIYVNIKSDDSDESNEVKISPVTGKILSGMSKLELFDKLNIILMLNKPDSEINIKQYGNGKRKFDIQIQQLQITRESTNSEAFPEKNFISHAAIRTVDTVKTLKIITRTAVKMAAASEISDELAKQIKENNLNYDIKSNLIVTDNADQAALLRKQGFNSVNIIVLPEKLKGKKGIIIGAKDGVQIRAYLDNIKGELVFYTNGSNLKLQNVKVQELKDMFVQTQQDGMNADVFKGIEQIVMADRASDIETIINTIKNAKTDSVARPAVSINLDFSNRNDVNSESIEKISSGETNNGLDANTIIVNAQQIETINADTIKSLQQKGYEIVLITSNIQEAEAFISGLHINGAVIKTQGQITKENLAKIKQIENSNVNGTEIIKTQMYVEGLSEENLMQLGDIYSDYGILPIVANNSSYLQTNQKCAVRVTDKDNVAGLLTNSSLAGIITDKVTTVKQSTGRLSDIISDILKPATPKQKFASEIKVIRNSGYEFEISGLAEALKNKDSQLFKLLTGAEWFKGEQETENEELLKDAVNKLLTEDVLKGLTKDRVSKLMKDGKTYEALGCIRASAERTVENLITAKLQADNIEISADKFKKYSGGLLRNSIMILGVQLLMQGKDINVLMQDQFIDSNMTVKQYFESIIVSLNASMKDIVKLNEYRIVTLADEQSTAKAVANFKDLNILMQDQLREKTAVKDAKISLLAVKGILGSA